MRLPPNYGGRAAVLSRRDTLEGDPINFRKIPAPPNLFRGFPFSSPAMRRLRTAALPQPMEYRPISAHFKIAMFYDFAPRTYGYTRYFINNADAFHSGGVGVYLDSQLDRTARPTLPAHCDREVGETRNPGM